MSSWTVWSAVETQEVIPHRAFITLAPKGRSRGLSLTAASYSISIRLSCKGFPRPLVASELINTLQRAGQNNPVHVSCGRRAGQDLSSQG